MALQLVDEGYDVWMGNNRGTKYSNEHPDFEFADDLTAHPQHRKMESEEKYNFSWYEMGVSDVPAMIEKI